MQKYEVTYDWILTIKAAGTPPTEVCVWCAYSRAEQGLHNLGHLFHSEVKYNNLAKDHTWSWRAKFTSAYAMVWFSAVIKSTLFSLLSNKACKKKKERKKKDSILLVCTPESYTQVSFNFNGFSSVHLYRECDKRAIFFFLCLTKWTPRFLN